MRTGRTRDRPTLDDPRYEHDACGVGFVADIGRRSRDQVLPLALSGLAALGHRGAFGADGESSDGAGVSLPLDRELVEHLAPGLGRERPGIVQLFLPRGRASRARARALIADVFAEASLPIDRWRGVPVDPSGLGPEAAASRPEFAQAIVRRPAGTSEAAFERRLTVARRRLEEAASVGRLAISVPSASARTIVYKGLVGGDRLARLYPDLVAGVPLRYAIFHQRYATNTTPEWRLAQPFRHISHNGEINTVRGNRQQLAGRLADKAGRSARELVAAGPMVSADGSDSLSLDEALELLLATGWDLPTALLATIPEALALRLSPHPQVAALQRRVAGFVAPWDGPAALVFGDGRRVGALLDRNGLRPLAWAATVDGLVAAASEAGAVPLPVESTIRRGRLGPGQLLLVDPRRGVILEDAEAKAAVLAGLPIHDEPHPIHEDTIVPHADHTATPHRERYLGGLDAERARLDIRTMALEGHEPLWSMGDDTPTPGRGLVDRRVADHLRQAFAQVTNPAIDPERERVVMDLRVEIGRRPSLFGGLPGTPKTVRLEQPIVVDLEALIEPFGERVRRLDATWDPAEGPPGLANALGRLRIEAVEAATGKTELLLISDASFGFERLPVPSVLAVGAVHTALTSTGLRGRTDIFADAADVLDAHALAMTLAAGATAVHPRLAIELAAEVAGTRGAEELSPEDTIRRLVAAFDAGLRKTLARMGISTAASYIGGSLFDTLELAPEVVGRCFPAAAAWPGRVGFDDLARRQLARLEAARALPEPLPGREPRLPDPGFARFRQDGEAHLYAPRFVATLQAIADAQPDLPGAALEAVEEHRVQVAQRPPALVRDDLRIVPAAAPVALAEVEPARAIAARFVVAAMSVGALSPEAHQALTIGIQRAGGAANTGEGGEDPAWYAPAADGSRHDARIKQVASGRFGVTAAFLARADQLEIKIAQGSKPGEGGQLPGRKATAYIAALRRGQVGQSYISPPPHHDIYSIEDLAQLIADLRAINPQARIGVKLVAGRGVGTIAAGVVKAGATYVHLSGHSGGTGASPLSSIKHAGAPWELGLAEVHQVLLRNGLRDRVALRTDGGLQTGRDILVAALLGAEEYAFGTAMLVAIGCDMARQCHLDTCPTGIATQREDLRAKFTGTPEHVERFALALAEDVRRELAAIGARSVGEVVGEGRARLRVARRDTTHDLGPVLAAPSWAADAKRRATPTAAGRDVKRRPASELERALVAALRNQGAVEALGLRVTTADRSFGAGLAGAVMRGELQPPVTIRLVGAAGQSFGAFLPSGVDVRLVGQANDYVAKGLSGGTVVVAPHPELLGRAEVAHVAGNTCLYGATGGRLHLVGRAGMRFAIRNSGAVAVVEGIGPHGCEYMTGGTVAVLGPVGANFGAGMTGGRAYLYDPPGRHAAAINSASVGAVRLAAVLHGREDGFDRLTELRSLLEQHALAGSPKATALLEVDRLADDVWLVEPLVAPVAPESARITLTGVHAVRQVSEPAPIR